MCVLLFRLENEENVAEFHVILYDVLLMTAVFCEGFVFHYDTRFFFFFFVLSPSFITEGTIVSGVVHNMVCVVALVCFCVIIPPCVVW